MIKKGEKGGQVTIFIIIAILIVALAILLYLYWPKLFPSTSPQTKNPSQYIQDCMEETIQDTVENISLQGGSVNPEYYYTYERNRVEYLCYTNQNYQPCVVQQPLLISHIQSEILNEISPGITNCFNSMKEVYTKQGYEVDLKEGDPKVSIIPKSISTNFNRNLTLIKGKNSERYSNFEVNLDSNLYDILNIATSIVYWETTQGGAPTNTFMDLYDLKIETQQQIDGTKIYIISEFGNGEDKFQFASRSFVRPQGITL